MNDLPPKIPLTEPISAKSSKPFTSKHVILGVAGGIAVGLLAGTLFWIVVWLVFFSRHIAREERAQAQFELGQATPQDDSTIAEIDAAAQLSFEKNIMGQFNQIAARPNLSPAAQAHLVEMVFKHLSFENNEMQVLLKLISNPAFSPEAKAALLKNLNRLSFENNKQALLDAIGRRENQ